MAQSLPRPLVLPELPMTLRTVADVRKLMRHLPAQSRDKSIWRYVERLIKDKADPLDISVALRMVLSMEGVECRPK
jgi:hypothetical protein